MPITDREIWNKAETRCFEYLSSEIGDTPHIKAFQGKLPEQAYNAWFFEIQGGAEPLDYPFNMETPGGCGEWLMNAQVVGKFVKRADAQFLGSTIRSLLPTNENLIQEVFRFRPRSEPRLEQDFVTDRKQGEIAVWLLTFELEVLIQES